MAKNAAGLIMYRKSGGKLEVFLVHPGGPFWQRRDDGIWSVPKGEIEDGEDKLEAAKREFEEETSFKAEGEFIYIGKTVGEGRTVEAWAFERDVDPKKLVSNTTFITWPPKSGKRLEISEVDRGDFFPLEVAEKKILKYQMPLLKEFGRKMKEY